MVSTPSSFPVEPKGLCSKKSTINESGTHVDAPVVQSERKGGIPRCPSGHALAVAQAGEVSAQHNPRREGATPSPFHHVDAGVVQSGRIITGDVLVDTEKTERGEAKDFSGTGIHRKIGQAYQNQLNSDPNYNGKNPGDIWEGILAERAQAGGSQRDAFNFYQKWRKINPKGTYEQFYTEVASKKIGAYQEMKWQTGIDNKQTAWGNYASYLNLPNPNGKPPTDFWDITTRAYPEAHFATFPPMLCVRPILASCPAEICSKCGKPRQRMTETTYIDNPKGGYIWTNRIDNNERSNKMPSRLATSNTVGWSSCSCNAGYEPGIVLDIFAGSGTACAVAKALGRKYLGIEINPKYVELAEKRIGKVITPLSPVTKVKDAEKALNEWQEVMG